MYCIHCGKPLSDGANYCMACGARIDNKPISEETEHLLPEQACIPQDDLQADVAEPPVHYEPIPAPECAPQAARKGSLRVPLIILAVLSAVGLLLYALFPMTGSSSQTPSDNHASSGETDTPWFSQIFGGLFFDEFLYAGGEELTVPETVDGRTVTTIGYGCFYDCDTITTVILPETLEVIEGEAFYDCGALRGIYIPEGVTSIGDQAFGFCTALEAISLPGTLETLDESAFDGCLKLRYVFFNGTKQQWRELYSGNSSGPAIVYCTDGKLSLG